MVKVVTFAPGPPLGAPHALFAAPTRSVSAPACLGSATAASIEAASVTTAHSDRGGPSKIQWIEVYDQQAPAKAHRLPVPRSFERGQEVRRLFEAGAVKSWLSRGLERNVSADYKVWQWDFSSESMVLLHIDDSVNESPFVDGARFVICCDGEPLSPEICSRLPLPSSTPLDVVWRRFRAQSSGLIRMQRSFKTQGGLMDYCRWASFSSQVPFEPISGSPAPDSQSVVLENMPELQAVPEQGLESLGHFVARAQLGSGGKVDILSDTSTELLTLQSPCSGSSESPDSTSDSGDPEPQIEAISADPMPAVEQPTTIVDELNPVVFPHPPKTPLPRTWRSSITSVNSTMPDLQRMLVSL